MPRKTDEEDNKLIDNHIQLREQPLERNQYEMKEIDSANNNMNGYIHSSDHESRLGDVHSNCMYQRSHSLSCACANTAHNDYCRKIKGNTYPFGSKDNIIDIALNETSSPENCSEDTHLLNESTRLCTNCQLHVATINNNLTRQSSVQPDEDSKEHQTTVMGSREDMDTLSVQTSHLVSDNLTSSPNTIRLNGIRDTGGDSSVGIECNIHDSCSSMLDKRCVKRKKVRYCLLREVPRCMVIVAICIVVTYFVNGLFKRAEVDFSIGNDANGSESSPHVTNAIQSVLLFIDWPRMNNSCPRKPDKIIWFEFEPTLQTIVRLSEDRVRVHVNHSGIYEIFASFNLDNDGEELCNMTYTRFQTLICMRNSRYANRTICQRQKLPPKSAITVPFKSILELKKNDYVLFTIYGINQLYRSPKGTYLTITKY